MLLEGTDRDYVAEKLKEAIFNDLRAWFSTNVNIRAFLDDLPDLSTPKALATEALNMAVAGDGLKYPRALEKILDGLEPQLDAKIAEILAKVRRLLSAIAMPGTGLDPFTPAMLAHKVLFWNRNTLRCQLREVASPAGRPILLINGEKGLGKSYSVNLFTHLKFATRSLDVAAVLPPLEDDTCRDAEAALLASDIVGAVGATPDESTLPGPQGMTDSQYAERLCRWVLNQIPPAGPLCTIVLDGFGLEGVNPVCRAFISRLAQKLVAGVWRQRLRLVLINYPPDDLAPVDEHILKEKVARPSRDDLKAAIAAALDAHGQSYEDSDLEQVLDNIVTRVRVPETDPSYYKRLNSEMRAVLDV